MQVNLQTQIQMDGSLEWHKARLIANGLDQRDDLDYKEMFAPVIKLISIRIILTIAI